MKRWSESADHKAGKVRNRDEKIVKNVKRIKEKKKKRWADLINEG